MTNDCCVVVCCVAVVIGQKIVSTGQLNKGENHAHAKKSLCIHRSVEFCELSITS